MATGQALQVAGRAVCAVCLRPQNACICHWITPVAHDVEVLILQHPLEVNNAKNTALLLHLSLPGSRLRVGETLERPTASEGRYDVLLYPDTEDALILAPPLPELSLVKQPGKLRLIVLDATWRKSRKMLHGNVWLQQLPRLPLTDVPASGYLIRKAEKPGQLSTFEATCAALMQLEHDPEKFTPLLTAFGGFVAQQLAHRP